MKLYGLIIAISMLAPSMQAQTANDNHAGWHLVCNDSLQGANVKAALDYLSMKGKKARKPVVVGIIDSGADTLLANISNALWTNPKERPDGKDNDRNGYVDDIHGWNFLGTRDGTFNMTSAGTEEYRQFKRLYPKYKGVKREDAADKAEYDFYLRMRKKAGINGYLMMYDINRQKAVAIAMMDSIMRRENINADTLTLKGVLMQEVQDTLWNSLGEMLIADLLRSGKTASWTDYKKSQADNLLLMKTRIDGIENAADKRLLMGDDLENAADIYYGNNTLTVEGCEHGTFVAATTSDMLEWLTAWLS